MGKIEIMSNVTRTPYERPVLQPNSVPTGREVLLELLHDERLSLVEAQQMVDRSGGNSPEALERLARVNRCLDTLGDAILLDAGIPQTQPVK